MWVTRRVVLPTIAAALVTPAALSSSASSSHRGERPRATSKSGVTMGSFNTLARVPAISFGFSREGVQTFSTCTLT